MPVDNVDTRDSVCPRFFCIWFAMLAGHSSSFLLIFPSFSLMGNNYGFRPIPKNDTKRYPLHRSVSPQTPPAHSHATTSISATTTTTTTTTTVTTMTTTTTTTIATATTTTTTAST